MGNNGLISMWRIQGERTQIKLDHTSSGKKNVQIRVLITHFVETRKYFSTLEEF